MAKAKYQFEDFLIIIKDDDKNFVTKVHEILLLRNYKPRLQITKSTGFQLSYSEPKIKTVAGIILIFFIRDEKLVLRLYGKNHEQYSDVLNNLPERIVNQINKADVCKKSLDPTKCWTGCKGYDFYIKEKYYQKCFINCFQLDVDSDSMPYLFKLIESESKVRCITDD